MTTPSISDWVMLSLTMMLPLMMSEPAEQSGDEGGMVLFLRDKGADRDHDGDGDLSRLIAFAGLIN